MQSHQNARFNYINQHCEHILTESVSPRSYRGLEGEEERERVSRNYNASSAQVIQCLASLIRLSSSSITLIRSC